MTSTTQTGQASPLVSADNISVQFKDQRDGRSRIVRAVDGVDLHIQPGETLGLVGESGCGKSTLGRAMIGLRDLHDGEVQFDGLPLAARKRKELRSLRRRMQIVFQDPYGSLNARMTVGATIAEPIRTHRLRRGNDIDARVSELLTQVGLSPEMARRYPHEFSGGQRQRVAIARALAAEPDFIVCDEPISALDVSIQAQILNLLVRLRSELSLTYLFISHDLAVVRRISTRIAVMYLGRVVELADRESLYDRPAHPYTAALLSSIPIPDPRLERTRERVLLRGDLPSPENPPSGCTFHTRCWLYEQRGRPDICRQERPGLLAVADHQQAACHFPLDPDGVDLAKAERSPADLIRSDLMSSELKPAEPATTDAPILSKGPSLS